jgi:hypothetical protein
VLAGDPTTLSHALNDIETEVVQSGLADIAIPHLPDAIAGQMRALWQAAVAVQLDDVVRLRAETAHAAEKSDVARRDAELRTEMLKVELAELRAQVTTRGSELAELRAQWRSLSEHPAVGGSADQWTLHVFGKGGKLRAIPLPQVCLPALRRYRLLRGLPAMPPSVERLPIIHSEKREALQSARRMSIPRRANFRLTSSAAV